MEDNRIRIKYHQGYDPAVSEKLSAVATALGGEFSDRPVGDGAREMSFSFENDDGLGKFFQIFKELQAEREEDQDKNREDPDNQKVEQCEQAIEEILLLVERSPNEGRNRRVLVDVVVGLERRKVKLGLMQTLRAARTPPKREPALERHEMGGAQHGHDLRRFFNQKGLGDEDFQVGLNDGDRMVELLGPMIRASLDTFNLSSAPKDLRLSLQQAAEQVAFLGLRTHCVCFQSRYRFRRDDIVSLERLYDEWCVKNLTTASLRRDYNQGSMGIPRLVFDAAFHDEVEPIQRKLGLGWWRRMKNRAKFDHLFWGAVLLGMLYDMKAKELADQDAGQPTVAQPSSTPFDQKSPQQRCALRITASGKKYVSSPAYEMQMVAAVAQFWVPEKEFYELLLNMTAMCLSESDPTRVGAAAFKRFVADNLPTLRAAIDRVKISQPAIKVAEENWERAQQMPEVTGGDLPF